LTLLLIYIDIFIVSDNVRFIVINIFW